MKLYFVRHGESEFNALGVHQHGQVPLSKLGLQQAKFVAKRFSRIPVEAIIASDYKRARQTAEEIAKVTKKKIIFNSLLQEVKRPSEIEGLRFDNPEAVKVKEEIKQHKQDPKWHYSDEENFFDFKERCFEFIKYISKRKEKSICVASHGFVIRMILGLLMFGGEFTQDQYEHFLDFFHMTNTGITVAELRQNGKWQLTTWNDYAHLGE